MKRTILATLTALSILLLSYNTYGEDSSYNQYDYSQYIMSDYISYNNCAVNTTGSVSEQETESRLRRFEVTFFISLPFVFIATYLTLNMYGVLSDPDDLNVDVWGDYKSLLMGGTALITTGISLREAIVWRDREPEKRAGKPWNKPLLLSFSRRF